MTSIDLDHHGDVDARTAEIDLAVNVRLTAPPAWLAQAISGSDLGRYPDDRAARLAVARHHRVDPSMVLLTSGAAEAFTLVARAIEGNVTIVHPQFTEPEAAMRAAGRDVHRHLLSRPFELDHHGSATPDPTGEVIMIGNPTNPTGVLHPRTALEALERRILIIDEAFMDAIPGEPETMIGSEMPGVLVIRSLTKTWGLAGLRVGYVIGDPELIRLLAEQQPPWSVSSPALAAMIACCSERARAEAAAAADRFVVWRRHLTELVSACGLAVVPGRAPFVLVDCAERASGAALRSTLATHGYAVRRGDTFPGLGPDHIRLAVRSPEVSDAFARALARSLEELA